MRKLPETITLGELPFLRDRSEDGRCHAVTWRCTTCDLKLLRKNTLWKCSGAPVMGAGWSDSGWFSSYQAAVSGYFEHERVMLHKEYEHTLRKLDALQGKLGTKD